MMRAGSRCRGAAGFTGAGHEEKEKDEERCAPHGGDGGGAQQCDEPPKCECCCFVGSGRELPVTLDCFGFLQANLAELSV